VIIDFKGSHYPKPVIVYAVFFYVRYGVSYRDLEEIMAERGVEVDHATLSRWVVKFSPLIAANAQARKRPTAVSWRMDETYIKVRGKWMYHYRAVDRDGQTLDFMLSERRDNAAARRFFKRAVGINGVPDRTAIDKSGANLAGLQKLNIILRDLCIIRDSTDAGFFLSIFKRFWMLVWTCFCKRALAGLVMMMCSRKLMRCWTGLRFHRS
jgi:putative transposase